MKMSEKWIFIFLLVICSSTTLCAQNFLGKKFEEVKAEVNKRSDGNYGVSDSNDFKILSYTSGSGGRDLIMYIILFNQDEKCFMEQIMTTNSSIAKDMLTFLSSNAKYTVLPIGPDMIPGFSIEDQIIAGYHQKPNRALGGYFTNIYLYDSTDEKAAKQYLFKEFEN